MNQTFRPYIDFDYELENAVIGVWLLEPHSYGRCRSVAIPECFYNAINVKIYEAITDLFDNGWPIDMLTVARWFYDKGVTQFENGVTVAATLVSVSFHCTGREDHLEFWCVKLRELAIQRASITVTNSGIDRTKDALDMASLIQDRLKALTDIRVTDDWEDSSKVAIRLMNQMESRQSGGDGNEISTGLPTLDALNGGFRPGQLVLIGARPAVGKSAFMGMIAVKAAHKGKHVGIITLEMDSQDVFSRMVSLDHDIEHSQIDRGQFYSTAEQDATYKAIADSATLPIYFSDTAQVNMRDIRGKIEKLKKKHGVDIVFIDYLQLVEPENSKAGIREQEVAKISRTCKVLAKYLKIPIVVLVQLNRSAAEGEPKLTHLRESGSLEQDADIVILLHRDTENTDDAVKSTATAFIRKWRNGMETKITLRFEGSRMKFMEMNEVNPFDKPLSAAIKGFQPPNSKRYEDD